MKTFSRLLLVLGVYLALSFGLAQKAHGQVIDPTDPTQTGTVIDPTPPTGGGTIDPTDPNQTGTVIDPTPPANTSTCDSWWRRWLCFWRSHFGRRC